MMDCTFISNILVRSFQFSKFTEIAVIIRLKNTNPFSKFSIISIDNIFTTQEKSLYLIISFQQTCSSIIFLTTELKDQILTLNLFFIGE